MRLAALGLASFGGPRVFRWMRAANRRMKVGRTLFRSTALSSNFGAWARAPGFSSVAMALGAVFLIGWWQMAAFRVRVLLYQGADSRRTAFIGRLFFQGAKIWHINLVLASTRLICSGGVTRMRIRCLQMEQFSHVLQPARSVAVNRMTPRRRGNFRPTGNSAERRRKPPISDVADRDLRRSFNFADVKIGYPTSAVNRRSAPRRKFCISPNLVPRYCERKKLEDKDAGEWEWSRAPGTPDSWGGSLMEDLGNVRKHVEVPLEGTAAQMHRVQPYHWTRHVRWWAGPRLPLRGWFRCLILRLFLVSFPPPFHLRLNFYLLFPPLIRISPPPRHRQ